MVGHTILVYTCIRVIGPFEDQIVDIPLFQFINAHFELWHYFVNSGDAESCMSERHHAQYVNFWK